MRVLPSKLSGEISVPTSKSIAHRSIICAALASGLTFIEDITFSRDVMETIHVVKSLGVSVQNCSERSVYIKSDGLVNSHDIVCNIKESASTLRFMIPVLAALGVSVKYVLGNMLAKRPLDVYMDMLPKFGVNLKKDDTVLKVSGRLNPGRFLIRGDVSSQFVSGMLIALPMLETDSEIILESPLQSSSYVDMTCQVMNDFGVKVKKTKSGFFVEGGQHYIHTKKVVEGDWSAAAFWLMSGSVRVNNVNMSSIQGDKKCIELFKRFNLMKLGYCDDNLIEVDASDIPDLVPILSVAAGASGGTTCITNISRLRSKESNRVSSIVSMLSRLGVSALEEKNDIIIVGKGSFRGGVMIDGWNDHRIVMAAAIAALYADDFIDITDPFSVCKSYPGFWDDYNNLGGIASVINLR